MSGGARLAIALGDPNGIGPEIALKALAALPQAERERFSVFGPGEVLRRTAHQLGLNDVLAGVRHHEAGTLEASAIAPGRIDAAAGASAVASATAAIRAVQAGDCDAVIACPHHETAIAQAGIAFSGYPSLVARVCGQPTDSVFLMLVGGGLRIVHVTLHESVRTALDRLHTDLIVRAARAGALACTRLGVASPRIGMFGINPHASEGELFGPEDAQMVVPAVEKLRAEGYRVSNPAGADTLLSEGGHDLYVAIFHDQGHIPIKLLSPKAASALSVGAGVLLCSVGHGSAMDIAGQGIAEPEAVLRSIQLVSTGRAAHGPSTPSARSPIEQ
ncbi:MAG: 4-hydroxythreonine-4-phosphate dehydrogenase PdxA [Hydrogenophaga sp.]|jgi:4-hydroxythreonine-4-phosphate dehydrogenase/1,2-dihydroxy-3,5-cyclohexadiene-1,4-dicarboxylate dehydrogenase|uniref:PdxA family dehydrogenase n=1 Tax=Hydrogenophaga sp. TaxID=1904254 RepID=UPI001DC2654F|nr:4-hydroxythreonine-4-phosphate dehydrogenase PdxA [Hydrogenophaga sp.]MBW0169651.1 4-hydroxythreonine-4-phosphate dehydrogenase PdxA [Hydrogenophaga sp.]MBW0183273.1 4-hydroxythreonine-4-phosphate dehydrogenase PdxA [Hydrogenophaga sp.]